MTDEAKKPWDGPERMTDDEIREFVTGVCDRRIFTNYHLSDQSQVEFVFMPIAFGAFSNLEHSEIEKIGCLYEYIDQASPTAINGMPTFFSVRYMHTEDWIRARTAINAELERRKSIAV